MWKINGNPEKVASNSHSTVWSIPVCKNQEPAEPFLIFERKPSVVIYAQNDRDEILLVHQHRFAINATSWELPQGAIENNESPILAARRELLEETNTSPLEEGKIIGEVYEAADWSTTKCYLIMFKLVQFPSKGKAELKTKWYKKNELRNFVAKGKIIDAITLASLYLVGFSLNDY